jgi:hypothetical protein
MSRLVEELDAAGAVLQSPHAREEMPRKTGFVKRPKFVPADFYALGL